jgi:hypothetical protein
MFKIADGRHDFPAPSVARLIAGTGSNINHLRLVYWHHMTPEDSYEQILLLEGSAIEEIR